MLIFFLSTSWYYRLITKYSGVDTFNAQAVGYVDNHLKNVALLRFI